MTLNCTRDRYACLHRLQLIPPLQPTVGIDGNLQQIVHCWLLDLAGPIDGRRCGVGEALSQSARGPVGG
jgi:hypothetical protein